ncbi:hypothetical protein NEPTK9_001797, partial [Candidatus Neptunochlamydia vexilliferae]|nr:hypothetical protein [Candidatus Neptunochlamydia vexilliferae]
VWVLMLARLGYIGYETNHLCIFKNLSHDFAGILMPACLTLSVTFISICLF